MSHTEENVDREVGLTEDNAAKDKVKQTYRRQRDKLIQKRLMIQRLELQREC